MQGNFVGMTFGKLKVLVVESIHHTSKGYTYTCQCDCGTLKSVKHFDLKHGRAQSCGCARHEPRVSTQRRKCVISFYKYKDKSKHKGLDFFLSLEDFQSLVTSPCHYCGLKPKLIAGVDRKDSRLGYVDHNVLPACGECNFAKSDTPYKDFLEWIERVHANMVH